MSTGSRTNPASIANTYAYDAENRLKCANIAGTGTCASGSETVVYVYDGEGRRAQKTVGPTTTSYVYDAAGALAAEYSTAASVAGTEWLVGDHLGSTRLVMSSVVPQGNPAGILKRYDYLPFGEEIPQLTGGRGVTYGTAVVVPGSPDVVSEKFTGAGAGFRDGWSDGGAAGTSALVRRYPRTLAKNDPGLLTQPRC